jgi:hypothetical protein
MHKKNAPDVILTASNAMGEPNYGSNDFSAYSASGHLSGNCHAIAKSSSGTGLNCGLRRVAPSGFYPNCPAIVNLSLRALKIIGLTRLQRRILITPQSATLFMMPLTFTKMAAS